MQGPGRVAQLDRLGQGPDPALFLGAVAVVFEVGGDPADALPAVALGGRRDLPVQRPQQLLVGPLRLGVGGQAGAVFAEPPELVVGRVEVLGDEDGSVGRRRGERVAELVVAPAERRDPLFHRLFDPLAAVTRQGALLDHAREADVVGADAEQDRVHPRPVAVGAATGIEFAQAVDLRQVRRRPGAGRDPVVAPQQARVDPCARAGEADEGDRAPAVDFAELVRRLLEARRGAAVARLVEPAVGTSAFGVALAGGDRVAEGDDQLVLDFDPGDLGPVAGQRLDRVFPLPCDREHRPAA